LSTINPQREKNTNFSRNGQLLSIIGPVISETVKNILGEFRAKFSAEIKAMVSGMINSQYQQVKAELKTVFYQDDNYSEINKLRESLREQHHYLSENVRNLQHEVDVVGANFNDLASELGRVKGLIGREGQWTRPETSSLGRRKRVRIDEMNTTVLGSGDCYKSGESRSMSRGKKSRSRSKRKKKFGGLKSTLKNGMRRLEKKIERSLKKSERMIERHSRSQKKRNKNRLKNVVKYAKLNTCESKEKVDCGDCCCYKRRKKMKTKNRVKK
jgi:hypothetical protein